MNTNKIYIQHSGTILRVYPELAKEIGFNESLVLLQIEYWISISSTEQKDGKNWTYQSLSEMKEKAFPFWSRQTINRSINNLVDIKILLEGNFNKLKFDKTRWFAINYEELKKLKSIIVCDTLSQNVTRKVQNVTRKVQNVTTIPEITTYNTTDKNIPDKSGNAKNKTHDGLYRYMTESLSKGIKLYTDEPINWSGKNGTHLKKIYEYLQALPPDKARPALDKRIDALHQAVSQDKGNFWTFTIEKLYTRWDELGLIKQRKKEIDEVDQFLEEQEKRHKKNKGV